MYDSRLEVIVDSKLEVIASLKMYRTFNIELSFKHDSRMNSTTIYTLYAVKR